MAVIVFGVSMFHILHAKSILDANEEADLVLFHPVHSPETRRMMGQWGVRLGYRKIIDLTDDVESAVASIRLGGRSLRGKFVGRRSQRLVIREVIEVLKGRRGVENCLYKKVILRFKVSLSEKILMAWCFPSIEMLRVSESIGEEIRDKRPLSMKVEWWVRERLINSKTQASMCWLGVRPFGVPQIVRLFSPRFILNMGLSSRLKMDKTALLRELGKVKFNNPLEKHVKVLIAGTMRLTRPSPNLGWTALEETQFYNDLIVHICAEQNVTIDEIVFVPHPRTRDQDVSEYKRNLSCSVIPPARDAPIELMIFHQKSIQAVYTYMSDSAGSAKLLFGITGVLIDTKLVGYGGLVKKHHYRMIKWRAEYCKLDILPVDRILKS